MDLGRCHPEKIGLYKTATLANRIDRNEINFLQQKEESAINFELKFSTWRASRAVVVTLHEGRSKPNRTGQRILALQAGTLLLVTSTVKLNYCSKSNGGG